MINFSHAAHGDGTINTIVEFVAALSGEAKRRKALAKKLPSTETHISLVVFIDDIFEILMLPHKKTPLFFIELLIPGATQDIYFILGSCNLLNQIINVNPSLQRKLKQPLQVLSYNQPLGAELVMNPDGLLFYREQDEKVHK